MLIFPAWFSVIFTDQFGRYMSGQLEGMILYAGEPKYLLFGTDWPISTMRSYINFMKQLDLDDESKELIMWKNASKLFKINVDDLKG